MARKTRSADTVAGAVGAMLEAAKPSPDAPDCVQLRDCDQPFWQKVVRARAPSEWTDPELVVAAQLARCQADIEAEHAELQIEGSVITNERGTRVANPRVNILEALARRQMALYKLLTLNATAKADARDIGKARKTYQGAVAAREELEEEDGLLAR